MERFEYKCIGIWGGGEKTTRILNEYGRDGWQLVAASSVWHWFKRRLPTADRRRDMERFEYKCISIWGGGEKTTRILNEYGRDGWELVAAWAMWHWFKRRLPDAQ